MAGWGHTGGATVVHWNEVHPHVKHVVMSPDNYGLGAREFHCDCVRERHPFQHEWIISLCEYHRGWNDALNATTSLRTSGIER